MTTSTDGKPPRDDDGPTLREIEFAHWVNRIFANWDAYEASLPSRRWFMSLDGWYSAER
jgi:hypothetical protein